MAAPCMPATTGTGSCFELPRTARDTRPPWAVPRIRRCRRPRRRCCPRTAAPRRARPAARECRRALRTAPARIAAVIVLTGGLSTRNDRHIASTLDVTTSVLMRCAAGIAGSRADGSHDSSCPRSCVRPSGPTARQPRLEPDLQRHRPLRHFPPPRRQAERVATAVRSELRRHTRPRASRSAMVATKFAFWMPSAADTLVWLVPGLLDQQQHRELRRPQLQWRQSVETSAKITTCARRSA